ncbi:MAG: ribokinase [Clostridiales bacterium]|nr:ribokinase [Clostridiales bacterium]
MMKILVLGSINIDYNYFVSHITTPKETQASAHLKVCPGGKGLNQAVTLARAGLEVHLAGLVGSDATKMLEQMRERLCVDVSAVQTVEGRTGHAVIQVDDIGQNAIMTYGGANYKIDEAYVDSILEPFGKEDVLVLQNEISCLPYILERAAEKEMFIVLNPSPCTPELKACDLSKVSLFFLNEVEGRELTTYIQPGDILRGLSEAYPESEFVFTLGSQGAFYKKGEMQTYHKAIEVPATDATAAGDVFEGYFLAAYLSGKTPAEALKYASFASALSVTKAGAAYFSAPTMDVVEQYVANPKHRPEFQPAPPIIEYE